jgi:aspartyl-tRNA(Asn)/glutamyl-tRNA(Gln) amidotransferase subunit A
MSRIAALTEHYRSGASDPVAEVEAAFARIAERDSAIKAFSHLDRDGALGAAKASAERWRGSAPLSPLDGAPVAIKDNVAVRGLPLTAGMTHRVASIADRDSVIAARLRAAGAIILGMTNMHEAALGSTTDNPHYGRTDNPAAPGHTPGGSSGGSAAALAAGFAPLAIGTDTMGSVRLPAAYCGVVGYKPSPGFLPSGGSIPLSWTLDTIGLIASDFDDIALAARTLGGADPEDIDGESLRIVEAGPLPRALTIGLPTLPGTIVEPEISDAFASARRRLETAGHQLQPMEIGGWDPRSARRAGLIVVEAEAASIHREALEAGAPMSEELRAMLDYGRAIPAPKLAESYRHLRELGFAARRALRDVNALALPTTPQRAFAHGTPAPASQADFTAIANIAGLPAVSIPLPVPAGDKPIGLQLIGRSGGDLQLLAIARRVASEIAP